MPRKLERLWLARDSAGALYLLSAADEEAAYAVFAREVLGMDTAGDFDAGNVDVDLCAVTLPATGKVQRQEFSEG